MYPMVVQQQQQGGHREAMLSLRAHALITGGIFAALIILAVTGNILQDQGLIADGAAMRIAAQIVFFGLCVALIFSAIPLMVKLVLGFQVNVGNADRAVVRSLVARERTIVFTIWALIALGLAVAIPAAIRDGAFDIGEATPGPASSRR